MLLAIAQMFWIEFNQSCIVVLCEGRGAFNATAFDFLTGGVSSVMNLFSYDSNISCRIIDKQMGMDGEVNTFSDSC